MMPQMGAWKKISFAREWYEQFTFTLNTMEIKYIDEYM